MHDESRRRWGAFEMVVLNRGLTVLSATVFCLGFASATSTYATVETQWYAQAFENMLRSVNLDGKSEAQPKSAPVDSQYFSRVVKEDNTITLRGQVPSEGDLKILQGVVAATSPGATLVDKTKVSGNVPDRDTWLAGMTFSLRQLSKLQSGSVILRNNLITIDGVTKVDDDFVAVQQKLAEEVPKGLVLEQVGVHPPAVRPFVWLAQLNNGILNLGGHVPAEFDRTLFTYAQTLFQNNKVSNAMASAVGAPDDWISAAKLSLDMLTLLRQGSVTINDRVIRLDGVLASPGMTEFLNGYRQRLPKGFKLEANILEPALHIPAVRADETSLSVRKPAVLNP